MKYALCIESIFSKLPFAERLAATRAAGYNAIEVWGVDDDRRKLLSAATAEGLEVAMIIGAGGLTTRDPAAVARNLEGLRRNIEVAHALNCPNVCLFVGDRDESAIYATQRAAVIDFLGQSAELLAGSGITGIVESLNCKDHPTCFLLTMADAVAIIDEVDRPEIKLQFDIYHTALTDPDVESLIAANIKKIAYFQAADAPSRAEPGTGELDYRTITRQIRDTGFQGYFSWEFWPRAEATEAITAARNVQQ